MGSESIALPVVAQRSPAPANIAVVEVGRGRGGGHEDHVGVLVDDGRARVVKPAARRSRCCRWAYSNRVAREGPEVWVAGAVVSRPKVSPPVVPPVVVLECMPLLVPPLLVPPLLPLLVPLPVVAAPVLPPMLQMASTSRVFCVPEHGSPKVVSKFVSVQLFCPRHAASTTESELLASTSSPPRTRRRRRWACRSWRR